MEVSKKRLVGGGVALFIVGVIVGDWLQSAATRDIGHQYSQCDIKLSQVLDEARIRRSVEGLAESTSRSLVDASYSSGRSRKALSYNLRSSIGAQNPGMRDFAEALADRLDAVEQACVH